jgi:hypothetical protein
VVAKAKANALILYNNICQQSMTVTKQLRLSKA